MNAAELVKRLVVFTDQRTLAEANTAGQEYLESAVDALNAAAQQIYLTGPATIAQRDFGLTTHASTSIGFASASKHGTTLTTTTSYDATWMKGCAIQIGSEPYNRINYYNSGTTYLTNQLQSDYTNATGTVFSDSLALPDDIIDVLPGVTIDDSISIRAATSEQNLYSESALYGESDYGRRFPMRLAARPPVPGMPRAYYIVQTIQTGTSNAVDNSSKPQLYLRLCPYPTTEHTIRFRATMRPPRVAVTDLDAANEGAACTKEIPLPFGWDELFLLPISKQFFTGSPFFNNTSQRDEIARAYKVAMENLSMTRGQADRPLSFIPVI